MKGSLSGKFLYLFCAIAGVLAGYGMVTLTNTKENIDNTKDNTLIRESEDSVFFVEKNEREKQSENSMLPKQDIIAQESEILESPFVTQMPSVTSSNMSVSTLSQKPQTEAQDWPEASTPNPILTVTPLPKATITPVITKDTTHISEDKLPSLGRQWVSCRENVQQSILPSVTPKQQETLTEEVITYPVQIFGQVPIINRSDAYVSYFEFAYDLVAMLEPVVEARRLNMNSLLTQFVIKALL